MIRNSDLYQTALQIMRKDRRGSAFTVGEFNRLLKVCNEEYFAQQYQKYELSQLISDSLAPFLVTGEGIAVSGTATAPSTRVACAFTHATDKVSLVNAGSSTPSDGDIIIFTKVSGTLPQEIYEGYPYFVKSSTATDFEVSMTLGGATVSFTTSGTTVVQFRDAIKDYYHLVGNPILGTTTYIDRVTQLELAERERNELTKASADYPLVVEYYDPANEYYKLRFYPAATFSGVTVYISYLRKPIVPFLDYVIPLAGNTVYLDHGVARTFVTGDVYPIAPYTPTTGTYYSQTVEMEWADYDKIGVLYLILSRAGITIDRADLAQYFDGQRQITNTI